MTIPLKMIQWSGGAFVVFALIVAGADLFQESDERLTWIFMIGSTVILLAGLGAFAPDLLLGLSYVFNIGGWLFYIVGVIAPVYFASRLLVIG